MRRPRRKDEKHLAWIRTLPCVICGNDIQTEAAHVRMKNMRYAKTEAGVGAKPGDHWTLPLCGVHHREQHERGENVFWLDHRKDPFTIALALWAETGDDKAATIIIQNN